MSTRTDTDSPYKTSRVLVWLLFWVGVVLFVMVGLVSGGQALDHFEVEATHTLGKGKLLMAVGLLILGPISCRVLRDACLAIFGYHDQVMALRRDMNALATSRGPAVVSGSPPPAPWQCPTCSGDNGMNDRTCRQCGEPFGV